MSPLDKAFTTPRNVVAFPIGGGALPPSKDGERHFHSCPFMPLDRLSQILHPLFNPLSQTAFIGSLHR
jgi:hypothetical protein